jgi:DNA-binding CsgD family transcriptional regulator
MPNPYGHRMVVQAHVSASYATTESTTGDLRDELARVVADKSPTGFVRDEILASWRHSLAMGLRPDRFELPYDGEVEESPFLRSATGVVDRLGCDLHDTDITVVLSDERARVVGRRVPNGRASRRLDALTLTPGFAWRIDVAGTNAIGLASAEQQPVVVEGSEHFMDVLTFLSAASSPIWDPRTAHILGSVTLVCSADAPNALMLPVARRAAREVAHRLLDSAAPRQRLLDEHFLRARRRTRGPLVVVGERTLLMNAAAECRLSRADQDRLWDLASRALGARSGSSLGLVHSDGSPLATSVEPVYDGSDVAGAVIRFRRSTVEQSPTHTSTRRARSSRPAFGWASLTETEHFLAGLVSEGLTNKEAAARLFLSRHTIDSHMRHIFRKLDINSRVDLARMVTSRVASDEETENQLWERWG